MFRFIFVFALLLVSAADAGAANIYLDRTTSGVPVLVVDGDLGPGDDKVFNNFAIGIDQAVVVFNSRGGLAMIGMAIGRTIAIKGFATRVSPDSLCASSCGLAWLAGRPRLLFPSSKVGFHAIFTTDEGGNSVSSGGNALVGSYLRELGLTDKAIFYVTMAQPGSMTWLSQSDAEAIGLDIKMLTENDAGEKNQDGSQSNIPVPSTVDRTGKEQSNENKSVPSTPTSAGQWTLLDNTDLMGFDISPKPIIVQTTEDCRLSCDRDRKCTAYTFNQYYRACFLKWGASQALQYTGAFSAYKGSNIVQRVGREYGPEIGFRTSRGIEILAMPYSTYINKNLAWCQDDCVDDFQCAAFSYYRNGICVKFREKKPVQRNDEVFSGVKTK